MRSSFLKLGKSVTDHPGCSHAATLVEATRDGRFVVEPPARRIGDLAYDSDRLDEAMLARGVELVVPNRANRRRRAQDGRPPRRWKVERLFAWPHDFRRLVVRWERYPENFLGFIHLACILIPLRRYS